MGNVFRSPTLPCRFALAVGVGLLQSPCEARRRRPGRRTRSATQPFEKEIAAFEAADARSTPAQGAVLFLGSSSIRKWTTWHRISPVWQ